MQDLRVPPANRLEALSGKKGQTQYPDQQSMADLFQVAQWKCLQRGNRIIEVDNMKKILPVHPGEMKESRIADPFPLEGWDQ
jgi:hypothetical protein